MSKGRPRKAGRRHPSGQLVRTPANDKGNDFVQARRASFEVFQGGKANEQLSDPIGRAWAVGLLEGVEYDAAILRGIGRQYGELYWHEYGDLAVKMGSLEPRDRTTGNGRWEDPQGERFAVLDRMALAAGRDAYEAMHALCVNEWWFPDINPAWVERLINTARVRAKQPVAGLLEQDGDRAKMGLAKKALAAMLRGA